MEPFVFAKVGFMQRPSWIASTLKENVLFCQTRGLFISLNISNVPWGLQNKSVKVDSDGWTKPVGSVLLVCCLERSGLSCFFSHFKRGSAGLTRDPGAAGEHLSTKTRRFDSRSDKRWRFYPNGFLRGCLFVIVSAVRRLEPDPGRGFRCLRRRNHICLSLNQLERHFTPFSRSNTWNFLQGEL